MGCFLAILLALAALLVADQGLGADGLGPGFLVGLVAGLLVALGGVYNLGWNAHVDHVEGRDHARASEAAERDRR